MQQESWRKDTQWEQEAEILGSWVGSQTQDRDTVNRVQKANKLWLVVYRRIPHLHMTPKQKGMVIQATVVASLLYGCETKYHSAKDIETLRRFMNRIIRGLTLTETYTVRHMEGRETMTDLRLKTGLMDIKAIIMRRTLGFLARTARRAQEEKVSSTTC